MTAVINQGDCIACSACVDACPSGIIEVDDTAKITDEAACTDCGTCVDTCPVEAIAL